MPTPFRLVITVLLIAVAAPTLADYKTCMTHCMTQHEFDHCHPLCASMAPTSPLAGDGADKPETGAPSRDGDGAGQCDTLEEKMDALEALIANAYQKNWGSTFIFPMDDENSFEALVCPLDDDDACCDSIIKVDGECRITSVRLEGRCDWLPDPG